MFEESPEEYRKRMKTSAAISFTFLGAVPRHLVEHVDQCAGPDDVHEPVGIPVLATMVMISE